MICAQHISKSLIIETPRAGAASLVGRRCHENKYELPPFIPYKVGLKESRRPTTLPKDLHRVGVCEPRKRWLVALLGPFAAFGLSVRAVTGHAPRPTNYDERATAHPQACNPPRRWNNTALADLKSPEGI